MLSDHRDEAAASAFYRSGAYDPQAAISNKWLIRISAIRRARGITMFSDSWFRSLSKSLRQNRKVTVAIGF
jgi:hypothetical protein